MSAETYSNIVKQGLVTISTDLLQTFVQQNVQQNVQQHVQQNVQQDIPISHDANSNMTPEIEQINSLQSKCQNTSLQKDPVILHADFAKEMDLRNEQDMVFATANNPALPNSEKLRMCNQIIDKKSYLSGSAYRSKLLNGKFPADLSKRGIFQKCPSNMHLGPYIFKEDTYIYIYGESTEKNIKDNCNETLLEQIENSHISKGMMNVASGIKWANGIILYNKNSILLREPDNNFGQPGFMSIVSYYDNLSIEIMKRYIVPKLIKEINLNTINTTDGYEVAKKLILDTYGKVYLEKYYIMNQPNIDHLNEYTLFSDAPKAEKLKTSIEYSASNITGSEVQSLTQIIESKDVLIDALDKRVKALEVMLHTSINKINEIEDIVLDLSIKTINNKQ